MSIAELSKSNTVITTYAYYPGCTLHSSAREYDVSARLVYQKLGIELRELPDWSCCGASSAHSTNHLLSLALPARDLQTAEEMGLSVVAACALCFSRLKTATHELKNEATRSEISNILGRKIRGTTQVVHLLQIVDGKKESLPITKPLNGLRVACYYGCYLVRPREIAELDSDENPKIMDKLVAALGAEAIDWPLKTECCGASLPLTRPDIVLQLCQRLLKQAKQHGADCLAVACPMCHSNLDTKQRQIQARYSDGISMPVFYFTQLMGLAMGFTPKQLLLDKHFSDPLPLLKEKGLD